MKTYERVKIAKNYIENKYKIKKADEENKKKEWEEIYTKLDRLNLDIEDKSTFKELILQEEAKFIRESRKKITIFQFEPLKIIGRGAFGEVRLCRDKETNEIVAVKKMKKTEMHKKNQVLHVKAEQEVLAKNQSDWVVKLKYSFQDDEYLYLVMEYLPGGDLMSLLMNNDIIPEDQAKLYIAEMVLAIEAVHELKCIHRDIKPDNILIDKDGHIKLSDFGLSRKADNYLYADNPVDLKNAYSHIPGISNIAAKYSDHYNNRKRKRIFAFSTVGTPDYIAPEVFSQTGYGPEVDWWSLGVILFEMIVGFPPFFSDSPTETCKKIFNWKQYLIFPSDCKITPEAKDLIKKLVTDIDKRLGHTGANEIKEHPFFKGIDWNNIRSIKPIFIPKIKDVLDTQYFDKFDEEEPFYPQSEDTGKQVSKDICFIDFDFTREKEEKSLSALLDNEDFIRCSLQKIKNKEVVRELKHNASQDNILKDSNIKNINIPNSTKHNKYNTIQIKNLENDQIYIPNKTPKESINKNMNFNKFLNSGLSNTVNSNNDRIIPHSTTNKENTLKKFQSNTSNTLNSLVKNNNGNQNKFTNYSLVKPVIINNVTSSTSVNKENNNKSQLSNVSKEKINQVKTNSIKGKVNLKLNIEENNNAKDYEKHTFKESNISSSGVVNKNKLNLFGKKDTIFTPELSMKYSKDEEKNKNDINTSKNKSIINNILHENNLNHQEKEPKEIKPYVSIKLNKNTLQHKLNLQLDDELINSIEPYKTPKNNISKFNSKLVNNQHTVISSNIGNMGVNKSTKNNLSSSIANNEYKNGTYVKNSYKDTSSQQQMSLTGFSKISSINPINANTNVYTKSNISSNQISYINSISNSTKHSTMKEINFESSYKNDKSDKIDRIDNKDFYNLGNNIGSLNDNNSGINTLKSKIGTLNKAISKQNFTKQTSNNNAFIYTNANNYINMNQPMSSNQLNSNIQSMIHTKGKMSDKELKNYPSTVKGTTKIDFLSTKKSNLSMKKFNPSK